MSAAVIVMQGDRLPDHQAIERDLGEEPIVPLQISLLVDPQLAKREASVIGCSCLRGRDFTAPLHHCVNRVGDRWVVSCVN